MQKRYTIAAAITAALAPLLAQSSAPTSFEVASVKPAGPRVPGMSYSNRGGPGTNDPGQISYQSITLRLLLMQAYSLHYTQVQGPAWIDSENYSVAAKVTPGATKEQFNLMLQNLLTERFQLVLRHEKKDYPVYDLVVAVGGPKMKLAAPDPEGVEPLPPGSVRNPKLDNNGFPILPPGAQAAVSRSGGMVHSSYRMTMPQFAAELEPVITGATGTRDVPYVFDRTGLDGKFEFTIQWAMPMAMREQAPAEGASEPAGAYDIFTAVEKQLGLRLVNTRRPMDLLVVEHAEKVPTEN